MFNKFRTPFTALIYSAVIMAIGGGIGAVFFLFELEESVLLFVIGACAAGGVWMQTAESSWEEKIEDEITGLKTEVGGIKTEVSSIKAGQERIEQRQERIENTLADIAEKLAHLPDQRQQQ